MFDLAAMDDVDDRVGWSLPSAYFASNIDRANASVSTGLAALASGRLSLVAVPLRAGQVVSTLAFMSGATAAATPTNQWFALFDSSRNLLRQTPDATTAAWAANTVKALTLTSTYTVLTSGLYYAGIMVAAATVPSLTGVSSNAVVTALAPSLGGPSTTSLTSTAPATAAAPSATAAIPLVLVG